LNFTFEFWEFAWSLLCFFGDGHDQCDLHIFGRLPQILLIDNFDLLFQDFFFCFFEQPLDDLFSTNNHFFVFVHGRRMEFQVLDYLIKFMFCITALIFQNIFFKFFNIIDKVLIFSFFSYWIIFNCKFA